jgi:hypothetical protein
MVPLGATMQQNWQNVSEQSKKLQPLTRALAARSWRHELQRLRALFRTLLKLGSRNWKQKPQACSARLLLQD